MRMALNIAQAVHIRSGAVTVDAVESMFHIWSTDKELSKCVQLLRTSSVRQCCDAFRALMQQHSHNFNEFLQHLILKIYECVEDEDRLIALLDDLAEIEYCTSFHVYTNTALFASVVAIQQALACG